MLCKLYVGSKVNNAFPVQLSIRRSTAKKSPAAASTSASEAARVCAIIPLHEAVLQPATRTERRRETTRHCLVEIPRKKEMLLRTRLRKMHKKHTATINHCTRAFAKQAGENRHTRAATGF